MSARVNNTTSYAITGMGPVMPSRLGLGLTVVGYEPGTNFLSCATAFGSVGTGSARMPPTLTATCLTLPEPSANTNASVLPAAKSSAACTMFRAGTPCTSFSVSPTAASSASTTRCTAFCAP